MQFCCCWATHVQTGGVASLLDSRSSCINPKIQKIQEVPVPVLCVGWDKVPDTPGKLSEPRAARSTLEGREAPELLFVLSYDKKQELILYEPKALYLKVHLRLLKCELHGNLKN